MFLFLRVGSRKALPENIAENCSFNCACVQATIFFGEVARCCIGALSRHAKGFQIIFHPAGLLGHKQKSLLGVGFDTFSV